MKITKVTPIHVVERIEPCLPLWTGPLGYTKLVEVPHGDRLGFVLLEGSAGSVMLQTRESLGEDLPAILARTVTAFLYVDVASLDDALAEVKGAEIVVPVRTTFYGAREACIADASGTLIVFAEHKAESA
jgi:uncharacterized glyoxalase superfamily protein PhnB